MASGPPRPDGGHGPRPQHQHLLEQPDAAQQHRAQESEDAEHRRCRRRRTEAGGAPAVDEVGEEGGRPGEGGELAHGRQAAGEQPPAADEEGHRHQGEEGGGGPGRSVPHRFDQLLAGGDQGPGPLLGVEAALEVVGEADAAPHLEAANLTVGHVADAVHRLAQGPQPVEVAHVPEPGRHQLAGLAEAAGEQGDDGLHQGDDHGLGNHPQQGQQRVALEHGAQVVAGLGRLFVDRVLGVAAVAVVVADHGRGGHQHPGPRHLGPPAEIDVGAVIAHLRVEAAQLVEQVAADEQARGGDGEDVLDRVVLLLVELAPVDHRRAGAGLVDHQAHLQQAVGMVPLDHLGGDDAGVGPQRLLHQQADGVGLHGHVVVAEHEERGALHRLQDVVGRGREAGPGGHPAEVRVGEDGRHPAGRIGVASGVHHQHRLIGVVLAAQRHQGFLEPVARFVGHDHRHHRRGGGLRFHCSG